MSQSIIIPDGETLFRYARPEAFPDDQLEIPLGIFQDFSLSCDWKRYRENPLTSFHISEGKTYVVAITVCDEFRNPKNPKRYGEVVDAWKQVIRHDPIYDGDGRHEANLAHSLIEGKKKLAVVDAIRRNSTIFNK